LNIVPPITIARFEQLEPGELFSYTLRDRSGFGVKTQEPPNGDKNCFVALGPEFPYEAEESFLMPWQRMTVVSFGCDYTLILASDAKTWFIDGDRRSRVCVAISDGKAYVCTNGGMSPQQFFPCFVELTTGAIVEHSLPGTTVYTYAWEMAFISPNMPPYTILKYGRERTGR
jgi:hypothetical protein